MPNWCENSLKVKGTRKNVLDFLNRGLRVLGVQAHDSDDARRLIQLYSENNEDNPLKDVNREYSGECDKNSVHRFKSVPFSFSMECYLPMPETYYQVDTFNPFRSQYPNDSKEYNRDKEIYEREKVFQEETFGAVGWNEWCCKNYGTKWNVDLEWEDMKDMGEDVEITFLLYTAWSPCDNWLFTVQQDNRLVRFNMLSSEPDCLFQYEFTSAGYGNAGSTYTTDSEVNIHITDHTEEYEKELEQGIRKSMIIKY